MATNSIANINKHFPQSIVNYKIPYNSSSIGERKLEGGGFHPHLEECGNLQIKFGTKEQR